MNLMAKNDDRDDTQRAADVAARELEAAARDVDAAHAAYLRAMGVDQRALRTWRTFQKQEQK